MVMVVYRFLKRSFNDRFSIRFQSFSKTIVSFLEKTIVNEGRR